MLTLLACVPVEEGEPLFFDRLEPIPAGAQEDLLHLPWVEAADIELWVALGAGVDSAEWMVGSSDSAVVDVVSVDRTETGELTVRVHAAAPGFATLTAVRMDGTSSRSVEVEVARPDGVVLTPRALEWSPLFDVPIDDPLLVVEEGDADVVVEYRSGDRKAWGHGVLVAASTGVAHGDAATGAVWSSPERLRVSVTGPGAGTVAVGVRAPDGLGLPYRYLRTLQVTGASQSDAVRAEALVDNHRGVAWLGLYDAQDRRMWGGEGEWGCVPERDTGDRTVTPDDLATSEALEYLVDTEHCWPVDICAGELETTAEICTGSIAIEKACSTAPSGGGWVLALGLGWLRRRAREG